MVGARPCASFQRLAQNRLDVAEVCEAIAIVVVVVVCVSRPLTHFNVFSRGRCVCVCVQSERRTTTTAKYFGLPGVISQHLPGSS